MAFSGIVRDDRDPDLAWTEEKMNEGVREKELPEHFATGEYQVLLVAEKYQTGFDQPLLHTMYVDKRLAGIDADQLFFDQIVEAAVADDALRETAAINPEDKFELVFDPLIERLFTERMDQNEEIFIRYMNDEPFHRTVSRWMATEAYRRLRPAGPGEMAGAEAGTANRPRQARCITPADVFGTLIEFHAGRGARRGRQGGVRSERCAARIARRESTIRLMPSHVPMRETLADGGTHRGAGRWGSGS